MPFNDLRQGSLQTALLRLETGANGFRRSGADRETRYTPWAAARHLHEVQTESSVTIRPPIRPLLNDLPTSALRRMFLQLTAGERWHERGSRTAGVILWVLGQDLLPRSAHRPRRRDLREWRIR